jgi:hypothetical protein
MMKDLLGSVVRAAVGVPQRRLELLAKVATVMSANNPQGEVWHSRFELLLKEGPGFMEQPRMVFERNQHGHVTLEITTLGLSGEEEVARFNAPDTEFHLGSLAEEMLTSTATDGYDARHRVVAGQTFKVVFLPGNEIRHTDGRTTKNFDSLATKLGYGKALANAGLRVREAISDEQMGEMGFRYIATLHEPIMVRGTSRILYSPRSDIGSDKFIDARGDNPGTQWRHDGGFIYRLTNE